jgi:similar to stage IV sporulation protein
MNRKILNYFEGVLVVKVKGKKIERFLNHLYKLNIDIIEIKILSREEANIKIFNKDFNKIEKIKSIYKIEVGKYEGKLRLKEAIKKNLFLIISMTIGYILLMILSNVIFSVEVIHSNSSIRNIVTEELKERDISRWHFKKNYAEISKIKKEILEKYKENLEWIEIESVGTKYIVKVEERKIPNDNTNYIFQNIVAAKSAIIMRIEAIEGEIVKQKNDYVKKGDILINGKIMKGEEVANLVKASGKIYGEVWYNIKIEHPLVYQRKVLTGNTKNIYKINFLNYNFSLFDINPYKSKESNDKIIVENRLLPFSIKKDYQKETIVEDDIYTDGEALIMAEEKANQKMRDCLDDGEYIISSRKLKYYVEDNKLYLDMFFKVYEDIGVAEEITE